MPPRDEEAQTGEEMGKDQRRPFNSSSTHGDEGIPEEGGSPCREGSFEGKKVCCLSVRKPGEGKSLEGGGGGGA